MAMRPSLAAAIVLVATLAVAGCGAGTNESASYCRRLADGRWVTNNLAKAACVPNPADATGNAAADGAVPLPRCGSCNLSDWNRAERRAAARGAATRRAADAAAKAAKTPAGVAAAIPHGALWPAAWRASFVNACTVTSGGRAQACGCIADHLARIIPIDRLANLSADDRRVYRAVADCQAL
jgi:hypothetical protein